MPLMVEIPDGTIDGTNTLFTTQRSISTNAVVTVNGMVYPDVDTQFGFSRVVGQNIFTMNTAPETNDVLLIIYE